MVSRCIRSRRRLLGVSIGVAVLWPGQSGPILSRVIESDLTSTSRNTIGILPALKGEAFFLIFRNTVIDTPVQPRERDGPLERTGRVVDQQTVHPAGREAASFTTGRMSLVGSPEERDGSAKESQVLQEGRNFLATCVFVDSPEIMHKWGYTDEERTYTSSGQSWQGPRPNADTPPRSRPLAAGTNCSAYGTPLASAYEIRPSRFVRLRIAKVSNPLEKSRRPTRDGASFCGVSDSAIMHIISLLRLISAFPRRSCREIYLIQ